MVLCGSPNQWFILASGMEGTLYHVRGNGSLHLSYDFIAWSLIDKTTFTIIHLKKRVKYLNFLC
jgi:hypothetical protein